MTLRLRHLRMRAITASGPYGADIGFETGLNVIWADNTKGKSTCMQAMLYVLGLEKMLSPRREIPLPHVMTQYVRRDDEQMEPVLQSWVELEIENDSGHIVTVHRPVKQPGVDNRLVTVQFGAALTGSFSGETRHFFVLDGGALQREDGFLNFLSDFIGWDLPMVRRFDGPESLLPIETIFPLFWVEQKTGWSAIPAAIPTYFRVREVQRRAVEFIMDLDVHKLELVRQRISERFKENARSWQNLISDMTRQASRNHARVEALPSAPTADVDKLECWFLSILEDEKWLPADDLLSQLRTRVNVATSTAVPTIDASANHLSQMLAALNRELETVNQRRIEIFKARQFKEADIASLERRIAILGDDLQKNQDVQKLQRYAGGGTNLTPDHCPTCEQRLVDALLPQDVLEAVMPIEDNIEYIRSQLKMFEDIIDRERVEYGRLDGLASATVLEINELYGRIRTVKTDLLGPAGAPSAAAIEERVRTEARIREVEALIKALEEAVARLRLMSEEYGDLLKAQGELPNDAMTASDSAKLRSLTGSVRQLARDFGFSTFDASELTIDEYSYRPQKEGYEIGFETSASDAIRLKWAYQLGLLELGRSHETNHPGLLLLDEPRQQSSKKVSFGRLLERAVTHRKGDQQVIVSTSEDFDTLEPILKRLECKTTIFQGYVIQPQS